MPKNQKVKVEFARRLEQAMERCGLTQSELARQASKFLPEGQDFKRDAVSTYINAKCLPRSAHLHALAKCLKMEPEELLPDRRLPVESGDDDPSMEVRDLPDGRAWLRINQAVEWDTAIKVLGILRSPDLGRCA